ncbi:MAG: DoxX family protein [Patescibacteria group bacterium]
MRNTDHFAPIILRLGLAVVFLWFGLQQFIAPSDWTAFVPGFTANPWVSPTSIILLNAWFEVMAAALLIKGFLVRPVAITLSLHMLLITLDTGGAIGMRDFGIAMACLALASLTPDRWSLDSWLKNREINPKHTPVV